jgi:pSer/pThr/pTyr-binding forkhead associated (FHA) protein
VSQPLSRDPTIPPTDPDTGAAGTTVGAAGQPVASRWKLVALADDGSEVRRFQLREGDNLVGSASPGEGIQPEVDLGPLDPAKNVSRRHAIISIRGDRVFLADHPGTANRGSRNGTWLDGVRVTATPVEVTERSDIAFAHLHFRLSTRA